MAVIYRNVTGPVKDSQGDLLTVGTFQANLHAPLVDGTTFVSPELVEEPIIDGQFSTPLAAPGIYDFTVVGPTEKTYWQFTALLGDDSGADISLAELFQQSTTIEMPDSTELFSTLLSLLDTPTSYVGKANYPLLVNSAEDAVVFGDVPVIDSHSSLTDLDADDHLQYVPVDGSRPLTASWNAGQRIGVPSILFDVAAGVTDNVTQGLMYWNATDQTLNLNVNGGPILQIGQEFYLYALNNTGATIPDGSVVYISGAQGQRVTVALGDASSPTHGRSTIGIATQDIPNNQQGFVTVQGIVRGLNTLGISEGTPLFLSETTPGAFQGPPPPEPPNSAVFVGLVIREHNTDGSVFVTVDDAGRISDQSDVHIPSITDGQHIEWVAANSRFENVDSPIGIPDPSGETDGDVLTIDTGAAVWAPAAGGGGGGKEVVGYQSPEYSGAATDPLTFEFWNDGDKTEAELATDGWAKVEAGSNGHLTTIKNVANFGLRMSGAPSSNRESTMQYAMTALGTTEDFDFLACAAIPVFEGAFGTSIPRIAFGLGVSGANWGGNCTYRLGGMEWKDGASGWFYTGNANGSLGTLYVCHPKAGPNPLAGSLSNWNYNSFSSSHAFDRINLRVEEAECVWKWIWRLN
jgi:hypothetical protein